MLSHPRQALRSGRALREALDQKPARSAVLGLLRGQGAPDLSSGPLRPVDRQNEGDEKGRGVEGTGDV